MPTVTHDDERERADIAVFNAFCDWIEAHPALQTRDALYAILVQTAMRLYSTGEPLHRAHAAATCAYRCAPASGYKFSVC
jgi:hypothetical protein